ncbi:MAG: beta-phosphoglucomutase [Aerococcus sp.]|nr:beta-phosphoglucomutase [Aerococcus sp.]
MTKQAFVFDLDGVITDTAEYHYIAWKHLAARIGITIDREFNEQLKGISRMDSLARILSHGNMTDKFSEDEKQQLATEKNTEYVKLLQSITPDDVFDGLVDFLKSAKQHGIRCVIASASKNAPLIIDKLAIGDYFDAIVDPNTLTKGKPDPEIFVKAVGCVQVAPEDAVGFEDAEAGIQGIKAAGMYAVGFESNHPLPEADLTIHSWNDVSVSELINL